MTLQRTDVALGGPERGSARRGRRGVRAAGADRQRRAVGQQARLGRLDVSIDGRDAEALAAAVVAAARAPAARDRALAPRRTGRRGRGIRTGAAGAREPRRQRDQVLARRRPRRGALEPAGRAVRFIVSDGGLGIPASEHARIFEKFFRLDPNLTRGVGGTGLGLYICQELVRRMDGRIRVESEPGRARRSRSSCRSPDRRQQSGRQAASRGTNQVRCCSVAGAVLDVGGAPRRSRRGRPTTTRTSSSSRPKRRRPAGSRPPL